MIVAEVSNTDSALTKQGFANDTSGLNVTIDAPGDATALTPTQATPGFHDALLKALSSNSLHTSQKKGIDKDHQFESQQIESFKVSSLVVFSGHDFRYRKR